MSDIGETSDGYHTFNELYDHRFALFMVLMMSHRNMSWKSRKHHNDSMYDGWFVAGMNLPSGAVSYHLPINKFDDLQGIETLDRAPEWDGHTSHDVIERLNNYCKELQQ